MAMLRRTSPAEVLRSTACQAIGSGSIYEWGLESVRDYMRRRYCDQKCMGLGERTLSPQPCDFCKTVFCPKNSAKKFCSQKCKLAFCRKNDPGDGCGERIADQGPL